jgi:hypothetical protein
MTADSTTMASLACLRARHGRVESNDTHVVHFDRLVASVPDNIDLRDGAAHNAAPDGALCSTYTQLPTLWIHAGSTPTRCGGAHD